MEEVDLPNQTTSMAYIRLRGLSVNQKVQMTVFALFLTSYVLTLIGNILIVITIIYDCRIHTPMYFFLSTLSFIDVCHVPIIGQDGEEKDLSACKEVQEEHLGDAGLKGDELLF